MGTQSVIIAVRERFGRFSEHRDSDFSSDSRQGFENGDVAMLAAFLRVMGTMPELLQELLKLPPTGQALSLHHLEARQDPPNLRFHGFRDTRRMWKAWRLQSRDHIRGAPSPNPVGAQHVIDPRPRQAPLRRRRRRRRQQRPQPGLIGPGAQCQHVRHEPMQLTPQLIRQAPKLAVEIILGARELAQLHDNRILVPDRLERAGIRAQRVGEHPRIAPVVFRPATVCRSRKRSSCFGLTANTRNPRARQASMSAPRGDSIATAICDGETPAYSKIQSKHDCTASAVWAIRRSSRRRPVASTTHTA